MAFLNELESKSKKNKKKGKKKIKKKLDYGECDISYVYNCLQYAPFRKKYLLLDLRDDNEFSKGSIYGAIQLCLHKYSKDQLKDMKSIAKMEYNVPKYLKIKGNPLEFIDGKIVVIYGNVNKNVIDVLKDILHKLDGIDVIRYLNNKLDDFQDKYSYLMVSDYENQKRIPKYPSEIIDGVLYLGNGQQSNNDTVIKNLNITAIVNATKIIKCKYEDNGIKYLHIKVDDLENESIGKYFNPVIQFVNDNLTKQTDTPDESKDNDQKTDNNNQNAKVLIHCEQGISRSGSFTIAYIMKTYNWTLNKSMEYVKERRWCVSPNDGFVKELKTFEQQILK